MVDEFSYYLRKLCRFCYKKGRNSDFKNGKCENCSNRNINPVYVNARELSEFVRDFRNGGNSDKGTGVEECHHLENNNKFQHSTECFYALNIFEYCIWNWMKTYKKYKIAELFNEYMEPFVFTSKQEVPCNTSHPVVTARENFNMINPVPHSHEENERIQAEERKKVYFCWFCLKQVISEHEISKHVAGDTHKLFYNADKKRRWYFKLPNSNPVVICRDEQCNCFSAHSDEEYREMDARIKFRIFACKKIKEIEKKTLNPWPSDVELNVPLFPRNLKCYNKPLRVRARLRLSIGTCTYICSRDDESRPYFCLYNILTVEKGQVLRFTSSQQHSEYLDFDIEFKPICSGTYILQLEFGFVFHENEYCSQKNIRFDVGTVDHLSQYKIIYDKYQPILNRDLLFYHIIPFSVTQRTDNTILTEDLLRRIFRVVPNPQWFDTRVESWNYCDWMRDMMVHEEIEQHLILSNLIFKGNVQIEDTFSKTDFIHAKLGQLFGTIVFKNECHDIFARDFLTKNIVKAFILFPGLDNRPSLYECDIVDKFTYRSESRSIKEITLCFSERTVLDMQLKSGTVYRNIVIYFRYNRLVFERRHKSLDKMPHYDCLSYTPLCCPSFTRVPLGEDLSSVYFKPNLSLNDEQKKLPLLVLRHLKNDEIVLPFILNGAFGTGKSSVIAETVAGLLNSVSEYSRVLICTRSYSAGCVYLDMFESKLSAELLQQIKMVIPSNKKLNSKYSIYNYVMNHEMFKANRVFITSIDNVADAMSLVKDKFDEDHSMFDFLFVDEAAQVLEVDAIMIYQFGNKKSKFIFAGDIFQVRPEYYNLRLKKFSVPIVSRLYFMYSLCPDYKICLKEVYRSDPRLVQLLSGAIYKDCGLTSTMKPLNIVPMKFIDANSDGGNVEKYDEDFCSYTNEREAEMVIMGIETLLNKLQSIDSFCKNILVCSPFYSQVKLIQDKCKKKHLKVYVKMPSAIQGEEYDAVFLSTVLTVNNDYSHLPLDPTFHSNKNLINLAISRAKHYVEVIGDKQSLLEHKCKEQWQLFIEFSAS